MGIEPKESVGQGVAPFPAERFVDTEACLLMLFFVQIVPLQLRYLRLDIISHASAIEATGHRSREQTSRQ